MSLKSLSNFRRTLEMSLIYYEVILLLTLAKNCVISVKKWVTSEGNRITTFAITDTKSYVLGSNFINSG